MSMRYRVVAGYVSAETAVSGKSRAVVDIPRGALLPDDVPAEQVEHFLRHGHVVHHEDEPAGKPRRGKGSRRKARSAVRTEDTSTEATDESTGDESGEADTSTDEVDTDPEQGEDSDSDDESDEDDSAEDEGDESDEDDEPAEPIEIGNLDELDKDGLLELAQRAGVEVDGRWAVERIAAAIRESQEK